jgi:DNA polymerase III subunit delta'
LAPADTTSPDVPEPRANPLLVGHEEAETALLRGWQSGRLHHAWLLTGPRGIGKATLAFRFARFALGGGNDDLFSGAGAGLEIDPSAAVFRQVASGGHPDLLTIERGYDEKRDRRRSEIVVEDVRAVGEFLHLKAAAGGWRVVVVDSADEMNRNAANALLKVLEEPPRQALLLLVAHAPGRLLPTIRSRCRRLSLGPLPDATVEELLGRSQPELAAADRQLLARLAEGSVGRALAVAGSGGLELYRDMAAQLLALPRLDVGALHGFAERFGYGGADDRFRLATELLTGWLGRMIRAAATGEKAAEIVAGETACMERLARLSSLDQWLELWEKIGNLFARTESVNLDRRQVWIGAMLDIAGLAGR